MSSILSVIDNEISGPSFEIDTSSLFHLHVRLYKIVKKSFEHVKLR